MACEFFDDGKLARCTAVDGLCIPSHHEREHYCRSDESRACPTFKLYQLGRTPVSQDAYYALWMPPPSTHRDRDATQPKLRAAV